MKELKPKKENKKDNSELRWFITVFITTFILSITFSFLSTNAISNLTLLPAIIILIGTILIGILFDIVGVAVTVAKEEEFHAKASKKIKGAKTSIRLIRNSARVANICADVIGDICGVLSGSIAALITMKITESFGLEFNLQFIISAMVASLTVSGKALGKGVAQKYSTNIVHWVGMVLSYVTRESKKTLKGPQRKQEKLKGEKIENSSKTRS